jgi:hypothetical protein
MPAAAPVTTSGNNGSLTVAPRPKNEDHGRPQAFPARRVKSSERDGPPVGERRPEPGSKMQFHREL